ncbi:hypothetical protein FRC05_002209 [Tulasnella sp. 425]|nr:hypothetical protein FRC05_002209 [Tulasnella sp. 425]
MLEVSLIFRIILENQHLEILRLTWITFTSSTPLTHSNTPIVLSHLKDLILSGLTFANPSNVDNHPHDPAFHILRHIRFPSCTKFTVSAFIESDSAIDPEELRSLLPSPLDLLAHPSPNDPQAAQPAMGYLSANISDHDLTLDVDRGPGYGLEYRVTLESASRSITRSWLQSALGDRPGVTLQEFSLHIRIKEHSHLDELVAFQDSEAVTLLSFGIGGGPLGEEIEVRILQMLATPYTLASGTTAMPFPRLSAVTTYGWKVQGKAVLEMVQKRFLTPGVDVHRPDVIVVKYSDDEKAEFRLYTGWDPSGVGWIHSVKAVHFGATNLWPWLPGRPRSPESRWPPLDENEDEDMDFTGGDESDWE